MIDLCVPYEARDDAARAGARWDRAAHTWRCQPDRLNGADYPALRRFLPRIHRRDLQSPFIRPMLVPEPCWGMNLRAVLPDHEWKAVRSRAYDASGRRCAVCGGRGPDWPVEADEGWSYNDEASIQTLMGVVALCPDCHLVRHWGQAVATDRTKIAIAQMVRLNGWSAQAAQAAGDEAMEQWHRRSTRRWTTDYGWITRRYGFLITPEGLARAAEVQLQMVAKSRS